MDLPAADTLLPRVDPAAAERLVRGRLWQLWRRRAAGLLLDRLCLALLLAATVGLLLGVYRLLRHGEPFALKTAWNLLEAAGVGALIFTLGGLPLFADVAAWIDRHAGTHDRFQTALDFAARPHRTPLELLTLAECVRYVERFPAARWTPLRLPRTLFAAALPGLSLGLLAWHGALDIGQPPRDPALQEAVAKRADALQKVAARLQTEDKKTPPDLARLAEAMQRSAEKLREGERRGDEQKLKTALGELSSLQAMLTAMKEAQKEGKVSPGEKAALAAALASNPQGRDAAEAIQAGQLERAGDQLEKLAEQMRQQGGGEQALQQLAQSMQEQAAKLSESERNEVARQMQQAAQGAQSGQEGLSQKAMQRLAELLRKAGRNGGQQARGSHGQSGPSLTEQQLQDLLNSLENMKEGLQPGGDPPGDGANGPQSLAAVEAFAKGRVQGAPQGDQPSGMPGSERDQGVNPHLLADKPPAVPKADGPAKRLESVLGDGATLQELVGATSGPARASRRYRDLYEAIAPAEQNSVEQENIPLGSRHLVRQYFENIRPQN